MAQVESRRLLNLVKKKKKNIKYRIHGDEKEKKEDIVLKMLNTHLETHFFTWHCFVQLLIKAVLLIKGCGTSKDSDHN